MLRRTALLLTAIMMLSLMFSNAGCHGKNTPYILPHHRL
jgi:hypothetical protein